MRLTSKALVAALSMLMLLCGMASAQTSKSKKDSHGRDIGPTCSAPNVNLASSAPILRMSACEGAGLGSDQTLQLTANAADAEQAGLVYRYKTVGGRIVGNGANVAWDLTGAQPGTYTATVEVDNNCGCVGFSSTSVVVVAQPCPPPPCPVVSVDCPTGSLIEAGTPVTFTANVSGMTGNLSPTYRWTVTDGTITGGQGTPTITVDTNGQAGRTLSATVELVGLPAGCQPTPSCAITLGKRPESGVFDRYSEIPRDDEKARLDNFAIQLQNEPGAQGYIVAYGGRRGRQGEAERRAARAREYLTTTRGIDPSRLKTLTPGYRESTETELWLRPTGAPEPSVSPTVQPSDVQFNNTPEGSTRRGATRKSRRNR
jgi:hypothetical protein